MKLIVGLGNPGKKYKKTRHNVGFMVVDELVNKWQKSKKANCVYSKQGNIEYIKPLTFMNYSGRAINYIKNKHYIKPKNIIVIHDDVDLPFGTIRVSKNSSSAGHKGVQSIIDELGTQDFTRVRIGVRQRTMNNEPQQSRGRQGTEEFVLQKFSKDEKKQLKEIIKEAVSKMKQLL